jgi:hypothetical protein
MYYDIVTDICNDLPKRYVEIIDCESLQIGQHVKSEKRAIQGNGGDAEAAPTAEK